MKTNKGIQVVVIAVAMFGGALGRAQGVEQKPEGAVSSGSTWCVFVNGLYNQFLGEIARLVDQGAEVQGGYQYENGKYSALVCKRAAGKPLN
jgi:hypothetical protein